MPHGGVRIGQDYSKSLRWRHNGRDSVSNHQNHHCLLNRLFRRRSKKTSKLRVTGLCVGNSPGTGEFPAQMACNAENVSIWWRHHFMACCWRHPAIIRNFNYLSFIHFKRISIILWNFNPKHTLFHSKILFDIIGCKMAAIPFRPMYVHTVRCRLISQRYPIRCP